MSENKTILKNILRDEWGSDAMIMSDWYSISFAYVHRYTILIIICHRLGVYSVDHAINAGLDLEMPGTNKWRTLDLMNRSHVSCCVPSFAHFYLLCFRIQSRKITKRDVRERAKKVLQLVQKCARGAPEVTMSLPWTRCTSLTGNSRFSMGHKPNELGIRTRIETL